MALNAEPVELAAILPFREAYRREMDCQIVHDSIHARAGWSREFLLRVDGDAVGYGSVAVGGPWARRASLYEVYVAPPHRHRLIDVSDVLLEASGAVAIEVQSNDPIGVVVLHALAHDVKPAKLLFRDGEVLADRPPPPGAAFRLATPGDGLDVPKHELFWHGVVEVDGMVAASGGVLFHYNPPYGDVYMEVVPSLRRRGLGSYLVQELARRCRSAGFRPAARCDPDSEASRRALGRAGFVPCGHLLVGTLLAQTKRPAVHGE